jgi:hypothetical protein
MTIEDYIKKLDKAKISLANNIKKAQESFKEPLMVHTKEGVKVCTHEINFFVDKLDYSIGKDLSVTFFSYEHGIPVYSYPPVFHLGKANQLGFGFVPNKDWEEDLKQHNINPDLIKKIKFFLSGNPPINYE